MINFRGSVGIKSIDLSYLNSSSFVDLLYWSACKVFDVVVSYDIKQLATWFKSISKQVESFNALSTLYTQLINRVSVTTPNDEFNFTLVSCNWTKDKDNAYIRFNLLLKSGLSKWEIKSFYSRCRSAILEYCKLLYLDKYNKWLEKQKQAVLRYSQNASVMLPLSMYKVSHVGLSGSSELVIVFEVRNELLNACKEDK